VLRIPLRLALLASLSLISVNVNAKTLYLDCQYKQCGGQDCDKGTIRLILHFLIDTTNKKAWRLESPAARPVKLKMNEEGQINLLDERDDGSVNVTTISKDLFSAHSMHPMKLIKSNNPVQQYYGVCGESKMIALNSRR